LRGTLLKGASICARERARSTRRMRARRARPRGHQRSLRSGGKALAVRVRRFRFGRLRAWRVLGHLRGHAPASAGRDEGTREPRRRAARGRAGGAAKKESYRGVARACPCERIEDRRNEAQRCASTEGEHAQCHAFRRSREARTKDRGLNRYRSRGASTGADESPRPRRVYIALGYVKGEARRRAGWPACAKRTRTRAVPGPINAFIGQRPLAARVTGRGTWGHAWNARCGAPGTNAPRTGARRGRGRVRGRALRRAGARSARRT